MALDVFQLLKTAVDKKASDIHIMVGGTPMVRVDGEIRTLEGFPLLSAQEAHHLIYALLLEAQRRKFEETQELDCSVSVPQLGRFRVNVLYTINGIEAVLRVINPVIPTPQEISFTPALENLAKIPRGLVLVTGTTGSGKSTTLATLIELINQTRREHILTIEDPVEFVYKNKKSIVRQREVGTSTHSFGKALKAALREDPDVILVGEMRDLETISMAITASETGHLVFGTLHTTDAPQTVDRMIDVFPPHQQQQVRVQLATTLQAVICQALLPRVDGAGRIAVREVMMATPAISNLIRDGKTHMIYSAIDTGGKFGMISFDSALAQMVKAGYISRQNALAKARDPQKLNSALGIGERRAA